jgi:hypothetical protein
VAQSDWVAGSELSVTIDGTAYPFKSVRWNPKAKMIDRANTKYSPGFRVRKSGLKEGTFTAEGPYKEGEVPVEVGEEYTFLAKPSEANVGFEVLLLVEDMTFSDDVEDGPNLSITLQTQGEFNPVIV